MIPSWSVVTAESPGVVFSFGALYVVFNLDGTLVTVALYHEDRFRRVTKSDDVRMKHNGVVSGEGNVRVRYDRDRRKR